MNLSKQAMRQFLRRLAVTLSVGAAVIIIPTGIALIMANIRAHNFGYVMQKRYWFSGMEPYDICTAYELAIALLCIIYFAAFALAQAYRLFMWLSEPLRNSTKK